MLAGSQAIDLFVGQQLIPDSKYASVYFNIPKKKEKIRLLTPRIPLAPRFLLSNLNSEWKGKSEETNLFT